LNNDEISNETSFPNSNRKASKIKFMLEEIPTLEHIKKRRLDLYKHWDCLLCHNEKEDFNHVWSCPQNRQKVQQISHETKEELCTQINNNNKKKNNNINSTILMEHSTIWSVDNDPNNLTFIDMIKGIVPSFITNKIQNYTTNSKITTQITSIIMNNIYLKIMERIWKPRCEKMIKLEISLNITKKEKLKKKKYNKNSTNNSSSSLNRDTNNLSNGSEGLEHAITSGGFLLDYYNG
jgi:hypothetical protein